MTVGKTVGWHAPDFRRAALEAADSGDLTLALCYGQEARMLDPADYHFALHYASWQRAGGYHDQAILTLQSLLRLRPEQTDLWFEICSLWVELGEEEKARLAYARYSAGTEAQKDFPSHLQQNDKAYIKALFDGYAPRFNQDLREHLHYSLPEKIAPFLVGIWGAPAGDKKIADLGAGTGLLAPLLRPYARELVAVDLSPEMLRQATALRIYDVIHEADIEGWLMRATRDYDLFVAGDVLVYCGDLSEIIAAAHQHLSAHGLFLFNLEAKEGQGFCQQENRRYAHSRSYIEDILAKTGFVIRDMLMVSTRKEKARDVPGLLCLAEKDKTT
jgi:predicted TPR repeat methyltransferase